MCHPFGLYRRRDRLAANPKIAQASSIRELGSGTKEA
jgi:hypothetical protein